MLLGKLIGGFLGYYLGGPWLALAGVVFGHIIDSNFARAQRFVRPTQAQLQEIQDCFFTSVFSLLGHLAKADGRISEREIAQTETYMAQMGLTAEHRTAAIQLFKTGATLEFELQTTIDNFRRVCGSHLNLVQMLMVYLINMATVDGKLDAEEEQVLRHVARGVGIADSAFEQLLRMIKAQDAFSSRYSSSGYSSSDYSSSGNASGGFQAPPADRLQTAYTALGVAETCSDAELKRAYRKLMSQYHPDKLMGQGLPKDMIQAATERSQEIQAAYDTIKRHRQ